MGSRLELQSVLEGFLGSTNVYYQPPASVKMNYDAIKYSKKNINIAYANNSKYSFMNCYEITLITRRPDSDVIDKILSLPFSSFDRYYPADNLNHYVFTLYY